MRHAGHLILQSKVGMQHTRAVFERHYLDREKVGESGTLPPEL